MRDRRNSYPLGFIVLFSLLLLAGRGDAQPPIPSRESPTVPTASESTSGATRQASRPPESGLNAAARELDRLQSDLDETFETLCGAAQSAKPQSVADDACSAVRRLLDVAENLAAAREDCFPPFSISLGFFFQEMLRSTSVAEADQSGAVGGDDAGSDALRKLETTAIYHERYARDMCSIYDSHRRTVSELERQRENDENRVRRALASRLGLHRFVNAALTRFADEFSNSRASFRVLDDSGPGPGLRLDSERLAEFTEEYLYVEGATGRIRYRPVASEIVIDGGLVYQPIDGLVLAVEERVLHSDITPAEHFFGSIGGYVNDAIVADCTRWLENLYGFTGQFFAADPLLEEYEGQEGRLRRVLGEVHDDRENVTAACEYRGAVSEAFYGVLDRTYQQLFSEIRQAYTARYDARFGVTNLLAQDIVAQLETEGLLGVALTESDLDRFGEALKIRARSYAELEQLRRQHARDAAREKAQQRDALEQLAVELGGRLSIVGREEESRERIAGLDFDARMRRIEAELTVAREQMASDREIAEAEIAQKDRAERSRSRTGILKSVIDGVFRAL